MSSEFVLKMQEIKFSKTALEKERASKVTPVSRLLSYHSRPNCYSLIALACGGTYRWVRLVLDKRLRKIVAYANNHYAGHGPATVKLFMDLWDKSK